MTSPCDFRYRLSKSAPSGNCRCAAKTDLDAPDVDLTLETTFCPVVGPGGEVDSVVVHQGFTALFRAEREISGCGE